MPQAGLRRLIPLRRWSTSTCCRLTTGGRYILLPDGRRVCCWVDQIGPSWRLRIGMVRRAALPLLEQDGELTNLTLPERAGLVETTHVTGFPENLVGVEFNFYGPRVSRVSSYLHERGGGNCPKVGFEHLLAAEPVERLQRFGAIKSMSMRFRPSYRGRAKNADFADAIGTIEAATGAEEGEGDVEVILRTSPGSDVPLLSGRRLAAQAIRLMEREDVVKFSVSGTNMDTGLLEGLNLLDAQLSVQKKIESLGEGGRAVATPAAYNAIEQAHEEIRYAAADAWGLREE